MPCAMHMLAEGAPHMDEGEYVEYVVYYMMSRLMHTCGFSPVGSGHLALKPAWIQVRGLNIKKTHGYKYR